MCYSCLGMGNCSPYELITLIVFILIMVVLFGVVFYMAANRNP